jgi:hypothetical protein
MADRSLRIRCRQMLDADVNPVIDLLLKSGFPGDRNFWMRGLARLAAHPTPPGFPKYGFVLEANEIPVGVLLMITTQTADGDRTQVRCNFSSWFVWPAFRSYATLIVSRALRHKEATYLNLSPLPFTWPILRAQGFTTYSSGRFLAVPALRWGRRRVRVVPLTSETDIAAFDIPRPEAELLRRHLDYGCIGLVVTAGGRHYPFLFDLHWKYRFLRLAYLVYCPNVDDFVHLAGPIGRHLVRRGYPFVVVDANGSIKGLIGRYWDSAPKYFKGPNRPRLGDLADTEQVIFGLIA